MSKIIRKDLKADEPGVDYWERTVELYLGHVAKARTRGDLYALRAAARMLTFSAEKLQAAALRVLPQ